MNDDPLCKCGHPLSSHNRNVREAGVDEALLGKKRGDIFTGRPAGESGCSECSCSTYEAIANISNQRMPSN